jgi:hypothetical protein
LISRCRWVEVDNVEALDCEKEDEEEALIIGICKLFLLQYINIVCNTAIHNGVLS